MVQFILSLGVAGFIIRMLELWTAGTPIGRALAFIY